MPVSFDRRARRVLVTASLVSSLIMLDSNIVAVALPSIARSLGASFADIEWVVSAYILCFAGLLLAAGSLADRYGRKRTMLIGIAVFAIASAACGLSPSALGLNLARAVQGVGASLLLTSAVAVINHAFVGRARAAAYAFWGACLGIALTGGPILGGVITSTLGWRWTFLVNVPVCIALYAASRRVVEESRDPGAGRIDLAGIVTFSAGIGLVIWALIDGNTRGWSSTPTVLRLALGASLVVAFVIVESVQRRPMIDLALFRRSTFVGSAFAMAGYAAGAQVLIFYLPLLVQNAYGFTPARAGLAMIPFAVPMLVAPRLAAGLSRRYSGRAVLTLGLGVAIAGGLALAALTRAGVSYPALALGMFIAGSGAGLLNGETVKVMQGAVPAERAGMASGFSGTVRFTALLVGVAAVGSVLARVSTLRFAVAAGALGLSPATLAPIARQVSAGNLGESLASVPAELRAGLHAAASEAFSQGFAAASLLAAGFALGAAIATFTLVRARETPAGGVSGEPAPVLE